MGLEQIIPSIALILILILVLPGFIKSNLKNKEFFKNKPKQKKFLKTLNIDRYTGVGLDDKYLRDNVVVSVHTRNIGG